MWICKKCNHAVHDMYSNCTYCYAERQQEAEMLCTIFGHKPRLRTGKIASNVAYATFYEECQRCKSDLGDANCSYMNDHLLRVYEAAKKTQQGEVTSWDGFNAMQVASTVIVTFVSAFNDEESAATFLSLAFNKPLMEDGRFTIEVRAKDWQGMKGDWKKESAV